jgi:hypothetical protein
MCHTGDLWDMRASRRRACSRRLPGGELISVEDETWGRAGSSHGSRSENQCLQVLRSPAGCGRAAVRATGREEHPDTQVRASEGDAEGRQRVGSLTGGGAVATLRQPSWGKSEGRNPESPSSTPLGSNAE